MKTKSNYRVAILLLFITVSSCILPESIDIKWYNDYDKVVSQIENFVKTSDIEILPNCHKVNGVENHFITVILRNDSTIFKSSEVQEILAKKIALLVYPEIENINDYIVIGILFENITIEGASEKTNSWSAAFETKTLKSYLK